MSVRVCVNEYYLCVPIFVPIVHTDQKSRERTQASMHARNRSTNKQVKEKYNKNWSLVAEASAATRQLNFIASRETTFDKETKQKTYDYHLVVFTMCSRSSSFPSCVAFSACKFVSVRTAVPCNTYTFDDVCSVPVYMCVDADRFRHYKRHSMRKNERKMMMMMMKKGSRRTSSLMCMYNTHSFFIVKIATVLLCALQ